MSKRVFVHPEPVEGEPTYWRSLEERNKTPEFRTRAEREFLEGASTLETVDRRAFLSLMGASFALAGLGLAGCREPRNHTLPYARTPELTIPGIPTFFATSLPGEYANQPILVETHSRRPTKVEGNPSHPASGTATSKFAQASVLDLYDPDRATVSVGADGASLTSAQARERLRELVQPLLAKGGAGLAFLARPSTSPTRARLVALIRQRFPKAIWVEHTPVDEAAGDRALGPALRALPNFAQAKRVVALDADFLGTGDAQVESTRAFAAARRADTPEQAKSMVRLYAVESLFTLTGAAADHRLPLATQAVPAFALHLLDHVRRQLGQPGITHLPKLEIDLAWVRECAADLVTHRGASLVVAGAHLPAEAHRCVQALNDVLESVGKTLDYVRTDAVPAASLRDLALARPSTLIILGGNPAYDAPVDAGLDAVLTSAKQLVRVGIYGPEHDDTSAAVRARSGLFIASTHYLESWDDGRALDGTYVPVQPMIAPLYDGIPELEVLATFADAASDTLALVRATFESTAASVGRDAAATGFDAWLAEGVLPGTAFPRALAGTVASPTAPAPMNISRALLEVRLVPSSHAHDGTYGNNSWLLEQADPMLKTCWENVILVSPAMAKELAIEPEPMLINRIGQLNRNINQVIEGKLTCQVVRVTLHGRTLEGPAMIMPGLAKWTLGLQLGFGRKAVGRAGARVLERITEKRTVGIGFNAYPLASLAAPTGTVGATLELTGSTVVVANTQDHWSMEGRDHIREGSVDEFSKTPAFAARLGLDGHLPTALGTGPDSKISATTAAVTTPRGNSSYEHPNHAVPPNVAVWQGRDDAPIPQQWGMSIDLNTCTGCNACVTACQSENNIPVVGRSQILKGRDMRWIRMDRYFFDGREQAGMEIPENPQVTFLGIACQHCENAPCESVCPTNATVHDEEGLNTMAYNRCIGTRYCANNCPYKVRRFNYLDYNDRHIGRFYEGPLGPKGMSETLKMQKNPDVTVRMRGVMEKCTFCVQRIQESKIQAKVRAGASGDTKIRDGALVVACQQACPAGAIEFGDISDATTRVAKAKASPRTYSLLGYLNVRPRLTYQAKLRNPNPRMPGASAAPLSRLELAGREGVPLTPLPSNQGK